MNINFEMPLAGFASHLSKLCNNNHLFRLNMVLWLRSVSLSMGSNLPLSTVTSTSQHRALSRHVECWNHVLWCFRKRSLSLWESLAPEWPAAQCLGLMHQPGSRAWAKQGLYLIGNKNLAWTCHKCLECQAAVVQKFSLFIFIKQRSFFFQS